MVDRSGAHAGRPEGARRVAVRGSSGYVDRVGVSPGESIRFHLSVPSAYQLDVVRLGRRAIIDPGADALADREDVEVLASFRSDTATQRSIEPGSYVHVDGRPIPGGPVSCGLWVRLWRLPTLDDIQWAWSSLISDLDYPFRARFALLIDHLGRVGAYVGDGGAFDHESMTWTQPLFGERLGSWVHVAMVLGEAKLGVFVDGSIEASAGPGDGLRRGGLVKPGPGARSRIGASAERGLADDFLDGDIAAPFVAATTLEPASIAAIVADRGRTPTSGLGLGPLHGAWELAEERGASVADSSGSERHGTIVQGGTWQIGGPSFDASLGDAGYEPAADASRGHGLRLSSDDLLDCEWPVSAEWHVPDDAASGLYAGIVRLPGQREDDAAVITFAVTRRLPRQPGSVALLLATNTWYAYGRRPNASARSFGLEASFYSTHHSGRPFFWLTTQAPIPRATPFGFESERAAAIGHSHLVRPERYAEAWLEREGYAFEVITDHDLHQEPGLLKHFDALMVVGHSEYWSDEARTGVEAYLDDGGAVLSLSGDSVHWRVSFDRSMTQLECRKTVDDVDPRWLDPGQWGERWHAADGRPGGSYRLIGRHAHETIGLDPQGMIDDGTLTGFRSMQVLRPEHWLFHEPERVPISPSGTIGESSLNGPMLSGYEFDAAPEHVGTRTDALPGQVTLATATQPKLEWQGMRSDQGADITYWERPAGGRVVSLGSIGATGALASDEATAALVRNVFATFGVVRARIAPREGGSNGQAVTPWTGASDPTA